MIKENNRGQTRLVSAGVLIAFALLLAVTTSFVFSGDATAHAWYIAGQTRHWLIIGGLSAVAGVVLVPLLWQGTRWQLVLASALLLLIGLILFVCVTMIRSLR
jgi:hypothetical protein